MFQNILGHHVVALCPIVAHRFENEMYIYQKLQKIQENIAPTFYGANKNRHTIFVKYGGERLESKVSVKFTRTHTQSTHIEHTRKHTIKSHAQSTHQPHTDHTPNNIRTYSDMFNQDCTTEMKDRIIKLAQDFFKFTGRHHGSIRPKNVLLCSSSSSILLIDFEQTVDKPDWPGVCEPGVFCISHKTRKTICRTTSASATRDNYLILYRVGTCECYLSSGARDWEDHRRSSAAATLGCSWECASLPSATSRPPLRHFAAW